MVKKSTLVAVTVAGVGVGVLGLGLGLLGPRVHSLTSGPTPGPPNQIPPPVGFKIGWNNYRIYPQAGGGISAVSKITLLQPFLASGLMSIQQNCNANNGYWIQNVLETSFDGSSTYHLVTIFKQNLFQNAQAVWGQQGVGGPIAAGSQIYLYVGDKGVGPPLSAILQIRDPNGYLIIDDSIPLPSSLPVGWFWEQETIEYVTNWETDFVSMGNYKQEQDGYFFIDDTSSSLVDYYAYELRSWNTQNIGAVDARKYPWVGGLGFNGTGENSNMLYPAVANITPDHLQQKVQTFVGEHPSPWSVFPTATLVYQDQSMSTFKFGMRVSNTLGIGMNGIPATLDNPLFGMSASTLDSSGNMKGYLEASIPTSKVGSYKLFGAVGLLPDITGRITHDAVSGDVVF